MGVEQTLNERGKTHGDFSDNAQVSQDLKSVVEDSRNWNSMSLVQREAIHMILHKVSRIVSGNPDYIDGWRDISGYAELVTTHLSNTPGSLDCKVEYFETK